MSKWSGTKKRVRKKKTIQDQEDTELKGLCGHCLGTRLTIKAPKRAYLESGEILTRIIK